MTLYPFFEIALRRHEVVFSWNCPLGSWTPQRQIAFFMANFRFILALSSPAQVLILEESLASKDMY
jgi:hypothetical protein